MLLNDEQQAIYDGAKGESLAKVMKTLVMYGDTFGATKMVPVESEYGHLVTSFGLSVIKPVYALMDKLLAAGAVSKQKFTVDPLPLDKNVPTNFLQDIMFKIMYGKQDFYNGQLQKLGILDEKSYTCTCYMEESGNAPKEGQVLSWAESSAVVYANSVLGARCNRNSGIIELFGSIVGFVPYFGLLTDEGRKAKWIIEVETTKKPEAQVLGSAIGMKVMEDVPYIKGLSKWIGTELNQASKDYLKDMGAATASNGAVGLYHVDGLTPEAVKLGEKLINSNAKVYKIDDAELDRVKNGYPIIWKDKDAKPKLAFIGCPHLSVDQLNDWTDKIVSRLAKNGKEKVAVSLVLTAAPKVLDKFKGSDNAKKLEKAGVVISYICPLMYMNNPLCGKMPVITNSNKLRTYTSAKYMTDEEILSAVAGEALA
ncbi:MAG: aconitase X catalytic domain-containing protein [Clostridiales bacterium]|jgi:predicted aconitase|nr:aconitase X catalytic domain-containing protein [Clostridiales bacterium]